MTRWAARGRGTLCALALTLVVGCSSDQTGALIAPAAVSVPADAPRITGRERGDDADHAKLVAAFGGEYRAPRAHRLLTEMVDRLVRATERPDETYAVTLLDSPVINAFALPTGRIYATRGLLALADDGSEIAAVLAHEIAHVTLRHATARSEMAQRSELVSRVVTSVLNNPAAGAFLQKQSRFLLARFSRGQELEADQTGVKTLARAGYDPFGAARFLTALERTATLRAEEGAAEPDMLATHPSTPERIKEAQLAARRIGAPGLGAEDRAAYLAAVDGIAYGDNPADGVVRERRFLHPRLGVAFEAPDGFTLENTARAVLGTTEDGRRRLLFDAVETQTDQGLAEVLRATWSDAIEPGSLETRMVNGYPTATARSRGKDWLFRLAAVRVGTSTFRMIMAVQTGASAPTPPEAQASFVTWLESLHQLGPEAMRALRPLRIQVVTPQAGDTSQGLSARMTGVDRPLERFLVLNGLSPDDALEAGRGYKLVVE